MNELRWSYDPRSEDLQVWEVVDERPSHWDVTGNDGYVYCTQGRVYHDEQTAILLVYLERPLASPQHGEAELAPEEVQELGMSAMREWIGTNLSGRTVREEVLA